MTTLDSPDTPLVLGLTPLMVASSCGHVDIVDALIQAGANINKQVIILDSPVSLLKNDTSPNVIIATTNETTLDIATILRNKMH